MQPLPPDLLDRLKQCCACHPNIGITLDVHKDDPRDVAFGWVIAELSDELVELRRVVEQFSLRNMRNPLKDEPMLNFSGGTLVIEKPKE